MLLVKIVNDLLAACDNKTPTLLMLLDLSAAFDTVDQIKLQKILYSEIGIHGIAYKWFDSFIRLRTQNVKVKNAYSSEDMLQYGVPQGSVLGPVLFNIYRRTFYAQVQSVGFVDDHQIRRSFSPLFQVTSLGEKIQKCFETISKWMNEFFLHLNPDETNILVICPTCPICPTKRYLSMEHLLAVYDLCRTMNFLLNLRSRNSHPHALWQYAKFPE